MKKIKLAKDLSGSTNQEFLVEKLKFQTSQLEGFNDRFESQDQLDSVLKDCASLALKHINPRTLQFDVDAVIEVLKETFGLLPYSIQNIVNMILFPITTNLIINYTQNNISDSGEYAMFIDKLDLLPSVISRILNHRANKPVLISNVSQEAFLNKLRVQMALIYSVTDTQEYQIYLDIVNEFLNVFCEESISQEYIH